MNYLCTRILLEDEVAVAVTEKVDKVEEVDEEEERDGEEEEDGEDEIVIFRTLFFLLVLLPLPPLEAAAVVAEVEGGFTRFFA